MKVKEIDKQINSLVIEKKLLKSSIDRTKDENVLKEMRKRIIMINAEIKKLKMKYDLVEEKMEENNNEQKSVHNK